MKVMPGEECEMCRKTLSGSTRLSILPRWEKTVETSLQYGHARKEFNVYSFESHRNGERTQ